jgi:hypothetical protein
MQKERVGDWRESELGEILCAPAGPEFKTRTGLLMQNALEFWPLLAVFFSFTKKNLIILAY